MNDKIVQKNKKLFETNSFNKHYLRELRTTDINSFQLVAVFGISLGIKSNLLAFFQALEAIRNDS